MSVRTKHKSNKYVPIIVPYIIANISLYYYQHMCLSLYCCQHMHCAWNICLVQDAAPCSQCVVDPLVCIAFVGRQLQRWVDRFQRPHDSATTSGPRKECCCALDCGKIVNGQLQATKLSGSLKEGDVDCFARGMLDHDQLLSSTIMAWSPEDLVL